MGKTFPLTASEFKTAKHGQVKGLSGPAIQNILNDYGITQSFSSEGGRTNRGSLGLMETYVKWLNQLNKNKPMSAKDLKDIEKWWVTQVKAYLAAKPFKLHLDSSKSIANIVNDVLEQAEKRQRESAGFMIQGAMMQHLVGAKLTLALPKLPPETFGFSVADEASKRPGDFLIGNVAIHVTMTPTEKLIAKCKTNLNSNLKPLVVTTSAGVSIGQYLSKSAGIENRVEFFEIQQFIAMNIYELSQFIPNMREVKLMELFDTYNQIVKKCEKDYTKLQIKLK